MSLTQISTEGIKDGTITNADIGASAAIAGSKIAPDFGAQNIVTTGKLLLGTTTEGYTSADDLTVATTGHTGITIRSGTTSLGTLAFSDGTSGSAEFDGYIQYDQDNRHMDFATGGGNIRTRILSNGDIGINTTTINRRDAGRNTIQFDYSGSDASEGVELRLSNSALNGNASTDNLQITYTGQNFAINNTENGNIQIFNNGSERMRIDSEGRVAISSTGTYFDTNTMLEVVGKTGAGPNLVLHRNDTTVSTNQVLAALRVTGNDNDGSTQQEAAAIEFAADGDHANNDKPSRIVFKTTADGGSSSTERMRIDSSGRLLVGTTTQFGDGNDKLMIENGTVGGFVGFGSSATFSEPIIASMHAYWADNKKVAAIMIFGGSDTTNKDDGSIRFATSSANNLTERMRIDSVGALNINTSVNPLPNNSDGRVHITCPNGGDGINIKHLHSGHCVNLWRANGDGNLVNFYRGDSSQGGTVGSISVNSSNTAFNTSSDYRLKENATAISDGITRLKKLKPYRFNFKIEPSRTVDGFFAHEVTPAVPEAITGEKDALNSNGDIDPQSIDQSKLVPLVVAALQETITKIEILETEVAALKAS